MTNELLSARTSETISGIQHIIRQRIIAVFREKAKTNAELGRAVEYNIGRKVRRMGHGFIGGVGDIRHMDEADPIFSLYPHKIHRIKNKRVRLWRILEYGAGRHIIEASIAPFLHFWSRGKWYKTPSVDHPGQKGRFFFASTRYENKKLFEREIKKYLMRFFRRYSV
jgi:hypothetical protein